MIDYRPFCPSIRDQGQCGSCTGFGLIGKFEPDLKRLKNENTDLSEAFLFFCSGGTCETGNTMEAVLDRALQGICLEDCFPYQDRNMRCEDACEEWWTKGRKIKSWTKISGIAAMKTALNQEPLFGSMAVYTSFIYYKAGIYHRLPEDELLGYHAITIVGLNDNETAWLCRNSWGTDWGEQGYFWIICDELDPEAFTFELDGEITPPSPSPCPYSRAVLRIPFIGKTIVFNWRKIRKRLTGK